MTEKFLIGFAACYCHLCKWLFDIGAPSWLVNLPQRLLHTFVPRSFRRAAFGTYLKSRGQS